jgi:hypothetical protein
MAFLNRFLDWASHGLSESEETTAYAMSRGASQEQMLRHRLGFVHGDFEADPSLDPGHDPEVCIDRDKKHIWCDSCRYNWWSSAWESEEESGPKVRKIGRRISGCVVFPLTTYAGTCVGFQIRSLKEKMYDSFTLKRRPEGYFFGIGPNVGSVWSSREIFLFEGPFDFLPFERLVSRNCAAITTSAMNLLQIRFLRRFVRKVHLCFDVDGAGRDGVKSFLEATGSEFDVRDHKVPVVRPKDKDTGDFWKAVGDDRFRAFFQRQLAA